ncbi:NepR family anti-sigma factor [Microvirga rosea]|uniref:NepR family anti-sigma factor n=1 Tax=Microvirga rosea TaxID=2715425 RepID=UPI001D09C3F7|nr:NepR family anti-sigma factor [Microvirga rosea]MCB8819786.1 hypothetical protein [Microvirga rosea]
MRHDERELQGLKLPNTLKLTDHHTALVIGHLLRKLYTDVLHEEHPQRLRGLLEQLDARERTNMQASRR